MRGRLQRQQARGFTLLEVLMALTVFSMIVTLVYSALGTAGDGFAMLHEVRMNTEKRGWIGKQLRMDIRYLTAASGGYGQASGQLEAPLRVQSDDRGDVSMDQLWLLVREAEEPDLSRVHYYVDQSNGHLMRESRPALATAATETLRWDFGVVHSWSVEVLSEQGAWQQNWGAIGITFHWPRAVRVKVEAGDHSKRRWLLPLLI